MNIFKKIYYRTYQGIMRCMIPFMPYREPKILDSVEDISRILKEKGIKSVIIVTDANLSKIGLYSPLTENLDANNIHYVVYDKTVPNPTIANIEEALDVYKSEHCNAIIAFGGGSSIDCAKGLGARLARPKKSVKQMKGLLKVRKKLPLLIAVPTTAGTGSETTVAAVITDEKSHYKYAINDFCLIPEYAVLDPKLTIGLPKGVTSTTGMDALTHAIEAYVGRSTTKRTKTLALQAIKTILENIKEVYDNPTNLSSRRDMLNASYKAGIAFTISYVGYVHAIAHSLGGKYGIAHGYANAIILPYVLEYFGKSIYKKAKKICVYSGLAKETDSPEFCFKKLISTIKEYNAYMNIPEHIPEIKEEDILELVTNALKEANPLYPVPRLAGRKELTELYRQIKG